MSDYLASDEIIQSSHGDVLRLAAELRRENSSDVEFARAAYEWVRDEVAHSWDAQDTRVTVSASEVLKERVGLCFAKSHLYAALLRSQRIAAGLCYQRLGNAAEGHVLHGLVAVHLGGAWHRQDARGNNDIVNAQFSLECERVAYVLNAEDGERDYETIYPTAVPKVLEALTAACDALVLCAEGLPDALPE